MSEPVKRPAIDLDEFERRLRQPVAAKPENDPLAELARLIGGAEDPYKGVFAQSQPQPQHSPAQGRQEPSFAPQQAPQAAPPQYAEAYYDEAPRAPYEPTRAPEDDAGWDMAPEPAAYAQERKPRMSRGAMMAAAIFGVGLLGIGGTYAFKGKMPGSGEIATIQASGAPVKVAPPRNEGEQQSQSATLLEKDVAQTSTRVVTREEQPVDLATLPQKAPRQIPMNGMGQGMAAAPAQAQNAAPPQTIANLIEPKKVKTVSVRPDGSIIPVDSMSGMAGMGGNAPLPVARPAVIPSASPAAATPKASTPKVAARVATTPAADDAPKAATRAASVEPKQRSAALDEETTATTRGQYAAQLAASPSEDEARATASRMAAKYSSELGGRRPTFRKAEVNSRTVYRVRVGGLTKDEASAICQKITGCFVARN
jgi:hypothetical protein